MDKVVCSTFVLENKVKWNSRGTNNTQNHRSCLLLYFNFSSRSSGLKDGSIKASSTCFQLPYAPFSFDLVKNV